MPHKSLTGSFIKLYPQNTSLNVNSEEATPWCWPPGQHTPDSQTSANKLKQSRIRIWLPTLHCYSLQIPPSFCFDQLFLTVCDSRLVIGYFALQRCRYAFPEKMGGTGRGSGQLRPKSSTAFPSEKSIYSVSTFQRCLSCLQLPTRRNTSNEDGHE